MKILKYYLKVYLKAFNFSGVSDVDEYLFFNIVNIVLLFVILSVKSDYFSYFLVLIILPSLSLTIRRLNDQKKSWIYIFLNLIPYIGPLVFFVICLLSKKSGINDNSKINNSLNKSEVYDGVFKDVISSYKNGKYIDVTIYCNDYLKANSFEIEREDGLHYSFEDISEFFYFVSGIEDQTLNIIWDKSKYIDILYYKALALFELKRHKESLDVLHNALDFSPVGIKYRFEIVENFISQKAFLNAEEYLEDLKYSVVKLSDFARLYRRIGYIKIESKNYSVARICFELSKAFEDSNVANQELKYINSKIESMKSESSDLSYNNFDNLIREAIKYNLIFELSEQQEKAINLLIDYYRKESINNEIVSLNHVLSIFDNIKKTYNVSKVVSYKKDDHNVVEKVVQSTTILSTDNKIFCPRCNEEIKSDSVYCSKCGKKIINNFIASKKKVNIGLPKKYFTILGIVILICIVIGVYLNIREKQRIERAIDNPELYWLVEATGKAYSDYKNPLVETQPGILAYITPNTKCMVTEIKATKDKSSMYYLDSSYDDAKLELNLKDFSLYGYSPLTSSSTGLCLNFENSRLRIKYVPILSNKFTLEEGDTRYILFEIPFLTPSDINLKYKGEVIKTY